jgi:hypothetical protein
MSCGCRTNAVREGNYEVRKEVHELLKHVNDDPYLPLHSEYTRAVIKLSEIGMPALRFGVLELLVSNDPVTRMRAENVLVAVTMTKLGWKQGGWPNQELEARWKELLVLNGDYNWRGTRGSRLASYRKWKMWVDQQM